MLLKPITNTLRSTTLLPHLLRYLLFQQIRRFLQWIKSGTTAGLATKVFGLT